MPQPPTPRAGWTCVITCAALLFSLPARSANAPSNDCDAYSGTITTDSTQQCLVNGSVTLVALPGGDAVIPDGYQLGFILTTTNGLEIAQVGYTPAFTVTSVGIWRIHSIVFDPTTLDLNSVLDLFNAYQLQELLVQGGGGICASLNISGAFTKTTECQNSCDAQAGTISALNPDLCLVDGEAQLEALPDGNAGVPQGFSVLHVLTTGNDLVIVNAGPEPSFTVTAAGLYTIHTLVYDPATLDISAIDPGTTTGFDVNALLQQGGGSICGALDVVGAQFQVADCTPVCEAFAGTILTEQNEVCLTDGSATISASPSGDQVVPDGYTIAYVLTEGSDLVIQDLRTEPLFTVDMTGDYTIHTLVYDPFTLDVNSVIPGTTTGFDVNAMLLQGGGTICGSLDVAGAAVSVVECPPPCTDNAGIGGDQLLCLEDGPIELFSLLSGNPDPGGSWFGPDGQPFGEVFDPATDPAGVYLYRVASSPDCPGDTTQLVIDLIECGPPCMGGGEATAEVCTSDPPFLMIDALDGPPCPGGAWTAPNGNFHSGVFVPGADTPGVYLYSSPGMPSEPPMTSTLVVIVNECSDGGPQEMVLFDRGSGIHGNGTGAATVNPVRAAPITPWPNPAHELVRMDLPVEVGNGALISLTDVLGRTYRPVITIAGHRLTMRVGTLPEGTYLVRILDGSRLFTGRFTRPKD